VFLSYSFGLSLLKSTVGSFADLLLKSTVGSFADQPVGSFADQPSETNTGDEPWNGEETMLLCRVKQCDVFSFSLRNI
jgi:hypothetical protein